MRLFLIFCVSFSLIAADEVQVDFSKIRDHAEIKLVTESSGDRLIGGSRQQTTFAEVRDTDSGKIYRIQVPNGTSEVAAKGLILSSRTRVGVKEANQSVQNLFRAKYKLEEMGRYDEFTEAEKQEMLNSEFFDEIKTPALKAKLSAIFPDVIKAEPLLEGEILSMIYQRINELSTSNSSCIDINGVQIKTCETCQ